MSDGPSYERLDEVLADVGAAVGPAQAHGILCGMMSAPAKADQARWMAQVLENSQPRGDSARACLEVLVEVFEATAADMEDPEFSFAPMLPGDDRPLAQRARALGQWCDGFLYGIGLGELKGDQPLAPDVSEALRDIGEIAQVEVESEADEENEAAYSEIVEYVRMAALLILESLRPEPEAGKAAGQKREEPKRTH